MSGWRGREGGGVEAEGVGEGVGEGVEDGVGEGIREEVSELQLLADLALGTVTCRGG